MPFVIVSLQGPAGVLESRIAERQARANDPSEATVDVLRQQQADMEELNAEERESTIEVDSEGEPDLQALAKRILQAASTSRMRRRDRGIRDQC